MKTNGPGKYDQLATQVRRLAGARSGVVVMVADGTKGSGFSVQGTTEFILALPEALEEVAAAIRAQRDAPPETH